MKSRSYKLISSQKNVRLFIVTIKLSNIIKLQITSIGNSAGIILPKELLEKLNISKGDVLYALETPNGFELTPYDPELIKQMEVAEEVMREDRNVLKKLAHLH